MADDAHAEICLHVWLRYDWPLLGAYFRCLHCGARESVEARERATA